MLRAGGASRKVLVQSLEQARVPDPRFGPSAQNWSKKIPRSTMSVYVASNRETGPS